MGKRPPPAAADTITSEATLHTEAEAVIPETDRWGLSFRIARQVRQQLEQAAKESGRSISAEVEYRLLMSFHDGEFMRQAIALEMGPELTELAWQLLDTVRWIARNRFALLSVEPGNIKNAWLFDQVVSGVRAIIEAHPELGKAGDLVLQTIEQHRPEGAIVPPAEVGFHVSSRASPQQREVAERVVQEGREAERNVGSYMARRRLTRKAK